MIALLALALVSFGALALLCGRVLAPIAGRGMATIGSLPPATAAAWLRAGAVAPLAIGLALSSLTIAVGSGALWPPHHCEVHGDGHLHLCFAHPPELGLRGWALLMVPFGYLLFRMGRLLARRLRARRLLRTVLMNAPADPEGFVVPEVDAPAAVTVGISNPTILISAGLKRALSTAELSVVLAHERAHVTRRDVLWQQVVAAALWTWPSGVGRALERAHALACERACDEAAATVVGGRARVAQVLLRIARLITPGPSPLAGLGPAFSEAAVVTRVEALLAPAPSRRAPPLPALIAGVALVCVLFAFSDPIHHAIESLYSFLLM